MDFSVVFGQLTCGWTRSTMYLHVMSRSPPASPPRITDEVSWNVRKVHIVNYWCPEVTCCQVLRMIKILMSRSDFESTEFTVWIPVLVKIVILWVFTTFRIATSHLGTILTWIHLSRSTKCICFKLKNKTTRRSKSFVIVFVLTYFNYREIEAERRRLMASSGRSLWGTYLTLGEVDSY